MAKKNTNPEEDRNVYVKKGGKFEPMGVLTGDSYLPDGLWYVHHYDYRYSTTSAEYIQGLFRMGGADIPEIEKICGLEEYVQAIFDSKPYRDLIESNKGYSLNEIIHVAVAQVFEFNKKIQAERSK